MAVSRGNTILLCLGLFSIVCCHCTRLRKLKTLDKLRGNSMLNHGQAKRNELRHGRLIIGKKYLPDAKPKGINAAKNFMDVDTDYQADMGFGQPKQPEGHGNDNDAAVERILKMEPKVECTGDSMKLQVQDTALTPGALFFVDRGSHLSPLPLSKLPPSCGYSIRSTQRNSVLVAPYDGCFVALEEDSYVLQLRWLGLPVRMSCPLMRQSPSNPPMVSCHAEGMVVKTEWTKSVSKIKANLNGNWEPLMKLSSRCGFGIVKHPEGLVISVRYAPCLEKKDGMYTLVLAGDGETKISCPSLSPAQPEPLKNPPNDSKLQTEPPSKREHPFTPSLNSTTTVAPEPTPKSPAQTAPEVPNEKPNEGPKEIYDPQLPYLPFYPHFFQPYSDPATPDPKPTPTPTPQPPASQAPNAESNQRYPEKLPEQPLPPKPTVSEEPRGQIFQPFYPYMWSQGPYKIPLPPTDQTPTTAPNGEVEQPLSPLEPEASKPKTPENSSPTKPPTPEILESPQTEAPQGQVYQPFYPYPYPFYQWPEPEKQPDEKPAAVPKPPQPEAPQGQVYQPLYPYPYPFYQQPEPEKQPDEKPTAVPKPPQPEKQPDEKPTTVPKTPQPEKQPDEKPTAVPKPLQPEKQLDEKPTAVPKPPQPFYPYPFYQWPEHEKQPDEKPTTAPTSSQSEAPQGSVHQPFHPQPEPEKPTAVPKPPKQPQPEAPHGQVFYPFYFNPFYPNLFYPQPNQPEESNTNTPPEAPQGTVYQPLHPSPLKPQPQPESQPDEKPTAVSKPPPTETPKVHKPFPQPSQIPGTETNGEDPTEKPVQREQPPAVKPPAGHVPHPLYPYYYYLQHPQSATLPPATTTQQQQQVTTPANSQTSTESAILQPSIDGKQPQDPQPSSSYRPPVYCPPFCSPGFSNCCPQISFHQHLHHIVPAGPGSKEASPVYTGLPFLPPAEYSGFGNGFGSSPLPQKPTEAAKTSTSAPISPQSLPSRNEKLQDIQPYFVADSLYPNWPYQIQNSPQGQSPAHHSMASKTHVPVIPLMPYEPYNVQPPKQQNGPSSGDMRNPSGLNFMPFVNPDLLQQDTAERENKLAVQEPQQSNTESSRSKESTHPRFQSELDHLLVPYYMLKDIQAPAPNNPAVPNDSTQQSVNGSKKPVGHEQTLNTHPEPRNFVLLQHGPPGREPTSFNESPLSFRHLVHDSVLPQNLAKPKGSKHQPPQETPQHYKWLRKGMSNPMPGNGNDMPRPGVESEESTHFMPSPQDPSLSAPHLKPRFFNPFKQFWKPMAPLGSNQRILPHVPKEAFQRGSSATHHQANGRSPRIQRSGNQKRK